MPSVYSFDDAIRIKELLTQEMEARPQHRTNEWLGFILCSFDATLKVSEEIHSSLQRILSSDIPRAIVDIHVHEHNEDRPCCVSP